MYLAVDFQGGIENAWSSVATFVPKLAAALVIVLVGYLVARAVASFLDKILERVGFDRVVERGGVRQVLARSKYDPSDILAKLVFWTIMLFVLQLAFGVFGSNPISDLLRGLIANGAGIAILVFAAFAALDQLQIAPRIVTGLWYAILAAVVGSTIVAVGGGGIRTMQRYWERVTSRAEERAPQLRQRVQHPAAPDGYDYDTTSINPGPGGASAAGGLGEVEGAGRRFRRDR